MEEILKHFVGIFSALLILCCSKRQHRYWTELRENRPSGSIRIGYTLSIAAILIALALSLITKSEWMWEVFVSILLLTLVFCVKITFSPTVIALTLAMCTYRMYQHNEFPLMEIWVSFTSILTWRLPEDVRAAYACVSFLWVLIATLVPSAPQATSADTALDGIGEVAGSLHA